MLHRLSLLTVLASLFLVLPTAIAVESDIEDTTLQEAQAINYYAIGRYRAAIRIWKQLLKDRSNQDPNKLSEISILTASAQESLGFPREACSTLQKAIDADPYLCDLDPNRSQKASLESLSLSSRHDFIAAITLANLLRDFGKFDRARELLEFTEPQVQRFNDPRLIAGMQISRADLTFVQLKLRRDRLAYRNIQLSDTEGADIKSSFHDVYQLYESAFDSPLHRDALSKWLRLHEEHRKFQTLMNVSSLLQITSDQYEANLDELLSFNLIEATEIEKIEFKLDSAQRAYEFGVWRNDKKVLMQSFELTAEALRLSTKIDNGDLLSRGYGQLGQLYLLSEQSGEALEAFQRASQTAQRSNKLHQLYKWQHELAKIFKQQGNKKQAATYFEAAIATLRKVEWIVAPLSSELRINFQEQAAPVFDDYIDMLLDFQTPNFKKVLSVQRKFAASELQNYLGCGTLQPTSVDQIFENDADAIVINIFKSNNEYYTIVESSDLITAQVQKINADEIESAISRTRLLLDTTPTVPNRKIQSLEDNLSQLYNQLIAPIEAQLEPGKTLVFALDPNFQQIPIGMFFDGNQYLIEKHPVAFIPPQLNKLTPVDSRAKDNVFFAGLSQARSIQEQQFSSLPYVKIEAEAIQANRKILNQSFTQERLIEQFTKDIPVFHIATHGQFSSDPEQTFILAWDDKITLNSLTSVVEYRAQNTPQPIELLVLSACETAKGDPLAALGLAGITVQAGTHSTLASLWQSDDLSSALIMEDFYQFWREGNSKAKALQLAQIKQIKQGRSPYSWGSFVLVGSWL